MNPDTVIPIGIALSAGVIAGILLAYSCLRSEIRDLKQRVDEAEDVAVIIRLSVNRRLDRLEEAPKPVTDPNLLDLVNVHPATDCAGRPCPMHAPTDHHMRSWPVIWRDDRGILERICPCGIGHPDPDQFAHWLATGREYEGVHGCCGHCAPPAESDDINALAESLGMLAPETSSATKPGLGPVGAGVGAAPEVPSSPSVTVAKPPSTADLDWADRFGRNASPAAETGGAVPMPAPPVEDCDANHLLRFDGRTSHLDRPYGCTCPSDDRAVCE